VLAFQADSRQRPSGPRPAWQTNAPGNLTVRLFTTTWENPRPDVAIAAVDFASTLTRAAPFLVAVTAEP
jgi:hypothetical protein